MKDLNLIKIDIDNYLNYLRSLQKDKLELSTIETIAIANESIKFLKSIKSDIELVQTLFSLKQIHK